MFEEAPDLLPIVAVLSHNLSRIGVHRGCEKRNPQALGRRSQQELRRSRDDQIVTAPLFQIPRLDPGKILFPEFLYDAIDVIQAVQEGEEALLQSSGVLPAFPEVEDELPKRSRQHLENRARIMPKAEAHKTEGAVGNKDRIVEVIDVHEFSGPSSPASGRSGHGWLPPHRKQSPAPRSAPSEAQPPPPARPAAA